MMYPLIPRDGLRVPGGTPWVVVDGRVASVVCRGVTGEGVVVFVVCCVVGVVAGVVSE